MLRVLVAEDEPLCRWALASALTSRGHDVATATTREEACARLFQERFDAVVLSSRMEGQDMADVAAELGRYRAVRRLVVLCGDEDCERLMQVAPTSVCVTRPFELAFLLGAVDPPVENPSTSNHSAA